MEEDDLVLREKEEENPEEHAITKAAKASADKSEHNGSALQELRWQAFLMLRSQQQEMGSQGVCAVCQAPLVTVTQLRPCHHAFCQSCVESNVGDLGQCLTCASAIDESDLMSDQPHSMVLAQPYATLKTHPEALLTCLQRGETLVSTREAADRLLLEFGVARGGGVRYVRVVPDMHGNHVRRGSLALGEAPPERLIERVDLGEHRLYEPNDPSLGYAFETAEHAWKAREAAEGGGEEVAVAAEGAVRARLTVRWVEEMAMEPLELRLRAPVGGAFFRRVLVQLPSRNLRGAPAKRQEEHEHKCSRTGGDGGEADGHEHSRKAAQALELEEKPVVFHCEEDGVSANGWVMYAWPQGVGASGTRAQASVHPAVSRRTMLAGDCTSKQDSEQQAEEQIGNVKSVLKTLIETALHNDELANLPARSLAELGEKRPPELLIEDIANLNDMYASTIFREAQEGIDVGNPNSLATGQAVNEYLEPCSRWHLLTATQYAKNFPSEVGGYALSLAGLAATSGAVAETHYVWADVSSSLRWLPISCALVLQLLALIKLLAAPNVVLSELNGPKSCGAYGSLLMSLVLVAAELKDANLRLGQVAVYAAGSLQFLMIVHYYTLNYRKRAPPVPFWFPATVGIGASTISGARVGLPQAWLVVTFSLSAAQCLLLWPWISFRLWRVHSSAPAPSVFIHAAPISLVSLAYFSLAGDLVEGENLDQLTKPPGQVFFALSTFGALSTLVFAYARRRILRQFILPAPLLFIHQEWAGLTFPLVATSTVALLFAARTTAANHGDDAVKVWPTILAIFCVCLLAFINIFFFIRFPVWLLRGLPPVPALPRQISASQVEQQEGVVKPGRSCCGRLRWTSVGKRQGACRSTQGDELAAVVVPQVSMHEISSHDVSIVETGSFSCRSQSA